MSIKTRIITFLLICIAVGLVDWYWINVSSPQG